MKKVIHLTICLLLTTAISAQSLHSSQHYSTTSNVKSDVALVDISMMEIYPNPVINVLNVEIDISSPIKGTYRLVDISGREIKSGKRTLTTGINGIQINVSDLDFGLYLVMIELEDKIITKRFSIYR
ncbi:MAG: T9SS type A sorting domain-containing protein [Bacteroidia bacterium]|nr:T9SS type A sorting domain-containing protein [Bacteroidia bacterium]